MEGKKSCVFCRVRKIRCSGASPKCQTCNARELNCVYELPTRNTATDATPSTHPASALGTTATPSPSNANNKTRSRSNAAAAAPQPRSFAQALDQAFASLGSETQAEPPQAQDSMPASSLFWDSLRVFTCDLVAGVTAQLSSLPQARASAGSFRNAYAADSSQRIFHERNLPKVNPSAGFSDNYIIQLAQLAFCRHPILAAVCSLAQLIDDVKSRKADRSLLNLILSEGMALGLPNTEASTELLAYDADRQLRSSCCTSEQSAAKCLPVLLLLAWRAIRLVQPKAAVAYLAVAGDVCSWWTTEQEAASRPEFTINGILSSHLYQELMVNMFWLCASAQCWIRLELTCLLPATFGVRSVDNSVPLPPLDASDSLIQDLDRLSGWSIASLANRADIVVQLRVLAHVQCLANHLLLLASELRKDDALQDSTCSQRLALEVPVILNESSSALPLSATASQRGLLSASYGCLALAASLPCALTGSPCTLDAAAVDSIIDVCRTLVLPPTNVQSSRDVFGVSLASIVHLATRLASHLLVLLLQSSREATAPASSHALCDSLQLTPAAQEKVRNSLSGIRTILQGFSDLLETSRAEAALEDDRATIKSTLQSLDDSAATEVKRQDSQSAPANFARDVSSELAASASTVVQANGSALPFSHDNMHQSLKGAPASSVTSPSDRYMLSTRRDSELESFRTTDDSNLPDVTHDAHSQSSTAACFTAAHAHASVSSPCASSGLLQQLHDPRDYEAFLQLFPRSSIDATWIRQEGIPEAATGTGERLGGAVDEQSVHQADSSERYATVPSRKRARFSSEVRPVDTGVVAGSSCDLTGLQLPLAEDLFPLWRHQTLDAASISPPTPPAITHSHAFFDAKAVAGSQALDSAFVASTSPLDETAGRQHAHTADEQPGSANFWSDEPSFYLSANTDY